eukprot:777680-Prymnesium_polylepis.1
MKVSARLERPHRSWARGLSSPAACCCSAGCSCCSCSSTAGSSARARPRAPPGLRRATPRAGAARARGDAPCRSCHA